MSLVSRARRMGAIAATAAVVITLSACGAVTTGSDSQSGDGFQLADYISARVDSGEPLRIAMSYLNTSLTFATPIKSGIADAAKDLDVEAKMIGPSDGDAGEQVAQIQTLIEQKSIDALGVASGSPDALKTVINQAYDAGIPIIAFNSPNPGSKQMAFVGQDLVASGKAAGEYLIESLGDTTSGKIVVFSGDAGAGWSNDRYKGFLSAFEGTKFDVAEQVNTGFEPNQTYNAVESTMAGEKNVVAIQSMDCCSFTAAGKWAEQKGKVGQIVIGGYDYSTEIHDDLEKGVLTFTVSQQPYEQGFQSVKMLTDFLRDGTPLEDYFTETLVITKENLDAALVEG